MTDPTLPPAAPAAAAVVRPATPAVPSRPAAGPADGFDRALARATDQSARPNGRTPGAEADGADATTADPDRGAGAVSVAVSDLVGAPHTALPAALASRTSPAATDGGQEPDGGDTGEGPLEAGGPIDKATEEAVPGDGAPFADGSVLASASVIAALASVPAVRPTLRLSASASPVSAIDPRAGAAATRADLPVPAAHPMAPDEPTGVAVDGLQATDVLPAASDGTTGAHPPAPDGSTDVVSAGTAPDGTTAAPIGSATSGTDTSAPSVPPADGRPTAPPGNGTRTAVDASTGGPAPLGAPGRTDVATTVDPPVPIDGHHGPGATTGTAPTLPLQPSGQGAGDERSNGDQHRAPSPIEVPIDRPGPGGAPTGARGAVPAGQPTPFDTAVTAPGPEVTDTPGPEVTGVSGDAHRRAGSPTTTSDTSPAGPAAGPPVQPPIALGLQPTASQPITAAAASPNPAPSAEPAPAWEQVHRLLGSLRHLSDGTEQIRVRLHPEELGEVLVEVTASRGELRIQLVTESPAARERLSAELGHLGAKLAESGLRTSSLDVGSGGAGQHGPPDRREDAPGAGPAREHRQIDLGTALAAGRSATSHPTGRLDLVL